MPRNIRATLEWHGPYRDPSAVTGRAGIYIVIAGQKSLNGKWDPSTYRLLDIGQTGDAVERLADHEREICWRTKKPAKSALLYKFAAMPSESYDETDRRIVECCLRAQNSPIPCGSDSDEEYAREDTVTIRNTGYPKPLSDNYVCGPEQRT